MPVPRGGSGQLPRFLWFAILSMISMDIISKEQELR